MTAGTEEDYTGLERTLLVRTLLARNRELETRLAEMERLYDKAAADLIEALDVASAYRATASTMHQEIERRNGVERRQNDDFFLGSARLKATGEQGRQDHRDRRKSWPR
jgi:hypothetical protein